MGSVSSLLALYNIPNGPASAVQDMSVHKRANDPGREGPRRCQSGARSPGAIRDTLQLPAALARPLARDSPHGDRRLLQAWDLRSQGHRPQQRVRATQSLENKKTGSALLVIDLPRGSPRLAFPDRT